MISENMPGAFHDANGDELCQVLCTISIVVVVFISRAEKNLVVDLRWFQVFLPEVDMKKSYLWSLTNYFVFKWKHISAQ